MAKMPSFSRAARTEKSRFLRSAQAQALSIATEFHFPMKRETMQSSLV